MISRRHLMALGAASLTLPARAAERPLYINALGGLANPNVAEGPPVFDARTVVDAHASGVSAVNITLGYVSGPADPHAFTLGELDQWDGIVADLPNDLLLIRKADDLLKARDQKRIGVIYGFQNAVQIGQDLDHANLYAERGVRVVQLTYNPANSLGDGSMAPQNRGLSELGRAVIGRLNDLNLMVDLSHSGEQTCLEAIAASRAPISINHTGCRALCDLPRNKTDAELRGVAERGGFVGIYFMPFLTLDGHPRASDVVAHIEHALKICGEDHVGIGTDGSITAIDDLNAYQAALAKEVAERAAAGIGAKGERSDTYPFVVDLRGVDQFRKLASLLAARGHSGRVIDKVLGGNFLSYARRVWG